MQLKSPTLALRITGALAASGLQPDRLEIEITEAVLIHDDETALAILHQLRGIGVRIALDDFGAGFSSLSYLKRFPCDKIRIDRCFVSDTEVDGFAAIVQAVVNIAAARNMTTTAEGVETEGQRDVLRSLGCTQMQVYLLSRPLLGVISESARQGLTHVDRRLRRPPAAIFLSQNRPDQPAKPLGLLVVQIAGQAERVTAGIDELLQRIGALGGVADHGDAGAGANLGDPGP